MPNLFITGSSGFIATHLAQRLDLQAYDRITFLSRTSSPVVDRLCAHDHVAFIAGSLYDADRYADRLTGTDLVVHLAAVTGKARPEAYFDTNAKGTEFFLRRCEEAGVGHFLHVSTIAVAYPDVSTYHYARSKQQAEDVVRSGRLPFTIVRPTVVLGDGAPIWNSLRTLAQGPVIPVFGDGTALLQPLHVDDLVTALLAILDERRFENETYDLGGPERLSVDDLLRRIHGIYATGTPRLVHLPLKALLPLLSLGEKIAFPLLPFTAGQLSLFRFDGTVAPNRLHDELAGRMHTVDGMLARLGRAHRADPLDREGRVLCAYLIGRDPSPYVLAKYREGNAAHRLDQRADAEPFERLLVRTARRGPRRARLADTYAALFHPNAVLRKKLILLLAILESCAPTSPHLDAGASIPRPRYYASLMAKGAGFALRLALSTLLFTPWRLALKRAPAAREAPPATPVDTPAA